jgi:hypothetical protein
MARAGATALGVAVLLVLLTWPLMADGARLTGDAPTDAQLISHQADALRQSYLPSHFVHSDTGIFYAVFAFYGGTLFAFTGAIALVVGSALSAQAIVYLLAAGTAYGGWFWLARLAGVGFWPAHAPALLYVTAPYVVTNVNARQDLVETVATAAIPLLLASGLSVLRADRLRAGPFAALAVSTIALGGSHNLTLLWGTTILGLTALVLFAAVPEARRLVTRRGLLRVLAVVVPAMAVNAWYLLPDLAYHSHTAIAQRIDEWRAMVRIASPAIDAEHLFALNRRSALSDASFTAALPVLAIAWVVLASAVVRKQLRPAWARTLAVLALFSVVVLVVMTHPRLITALPDPWQMVQFSYRLETFVLFGICGAVIVLLAQGTSGWLTWLLVPIVAFSVFGALKQVRDVPRNPRDFTLAIDNFNTFSAGDFADVSVQRQRVTKGARPRVVTRAPVRRDRLETTIAAQPGEDVYLTLMGIAEMLDVQGARVVGRWTVAPQSPGWQSRSYLTLRIDDDATPGRARIVVREARTLPIVGGRIISLLGLLGLAAGAAVIARGSLSRRRMS